MIYCLAPAYNEAQNLPAWAENLSTLFRKLDEPCTLVAVNDGSSDETASVLETLETRFPLQVVTHEKNRGAGAAFQSGFLRVLELASDSDLLLTLEADNTSDLSIVPEMLRKLRADTDFILASCYAEGGKVQGSTWLRHALSWIANQIISLLFGLRGVHTYSSFYRAIRVGTLRQAWNAFEGQLLTERGYLCMVEMLVKVSRLPIRIQEIPTILHCDWRKGKSKMKVLKTTITYFRFFASELFRDRIKDKKALERWKETLST